MPFTIQNKMNRPVMIRLNSGLTCYLNAGEKSEKIIDVEVHNNHKLSRLQARNIIELIQVKQRVKAAPKAAAKKAKKVTKK